MIVILGILFSTTSLFRVAGEKQTALVRPDFSLWKSMKGASIVIAQSAVERVSSAGSVFSQKKNIVIKPTNEIRNSNIEIRNND